MAHSKFYQEELAIQACKKVHGGHFENPDQTITAERTAGHVPHQSIDSGRSIAGRSTGWSTLKPLVLCQGSIFVCWHAVVASSRQGSIGRWRLEATTTTLILNSDKALEYSLESLGTMYWADRHNQQSRKRDLSDG